MIKYKGAKSPGLQGTLREYSSSRNGYIVAVNVDLEVYLLHDLYHIVAYLYWHY